MTDVVKKIVFRGLEKKEEILFKSFLNLVKNDLDYTVELIQDPDALLDDADIVIADAEYELTDEESTMAPLPTLYIREYIFCQSYFGVRPIALKFEHVIWWDMQFSLDNFL
mgnify:CR=1 FL=1